MKRENLIGVIIIIIILVLLIIMTITIASKQESVYENRVEKLEVENSLLKSNLEYYKKEAIEMELYFEYLNDIDRLNKEVFKEGIYIDIDGEIHAYEVITIEYEVDYVQFYEDMESFVHYYIQWYSNDPQTSFEDYIYNIDRELYNRFEYYDEVYYEVRPWPHTSANHAIKRNTLLTQGKKAHNVYIVMEKLRRRKRDERRIKGIKKNRIR